MGVGGAGQGKAVVAAFPVILHRLASKAEARLDMATLLLGLFFVRGRIGFGLHPDSGTWTCAISVLVYPEHPFSRVEAPNRL